ncbi:MAG: hypothetical protein ACLUD2_17675 [Clostridium sp.]
MKSISIYAITRKQNLAQLSRMERQLSKREKPLKCGMGVRQPENLVEQLVPDAGYLRVDCAFSIPSRFRGWERNLIFFRSRKTRLSILS